MKDTLNSITVSLDIPSLGDSDARFHLFLAQVIQCKYRIPSRLNEQLELLYQHYLCGEIVHEYLIHDKKVLFPDIRPRTSIHTRIPDYTGEQFNQLKRDLQTVHHRFGVTDQDRHALMHHYRFCMIWKLHMSYTRHISKNQVLN